MTTDSIYCIQCIVFAVLKLNYLGYMVEHHLFIILFF